MSRKGNRGQAQAKGARRCMLCERPGVSFVNYKTTRGSIVKLCGPCFKRVMAAAIERNKASGQTTDSGVKNNADN